MRRIVSAVKRKQALLFCMASVLGLVLVCIPLFVVAKYNYMSADDLGYGAITHDAILNGQPWRIFGLAGVFRQFFCLRCNREFGEKSIINWEFILLFSF